MPSTIVYWRGSAEIRTELINAFSNEGEQVLTVRSLDELLDLLPKQAISMLIADGSAGEREASNRVVELTSTPKLFPIPVMFISVLASKRGAVLKNQFKTFLPVDIPFNVDEVLKRAAPVLARGTLKEKPVEDARAPREGAKEERKGKDALISITGKLLARANSPEAFDDNLIIPDTSVQRVIKQALDRITEADPWLGLHARRVSLLSSTISTELHLTAERSNAIKTSGLFMNWGILEDWGLLENFNNLRRMDIFLVFDRDAIEALARGIERSATFITERIKDERVKDTMNCVAAMLRGSNLSVSKDLHEDAQCVMVSEFINRACWSGGIWNGFGAYRSIKHIRGGMLRNVDPRIASSAIAALGDAIVSGGNILTAFIMSPAQQVAAAQEIAEAEKEAKALFSDEITAKRFITQLATGERVARPITTVDGQLVLRANVELDQDMIWRLWQLGAVRALDPEVRIVATEKIKSSKNKSR